MIILSCFMLNFNQSVIFLFGLYLSGQPIFNSKLKFSNYAWGEDYHEVLKSKLYDFLHWIKKSEPNLKGIACVDTSPVMEKVIAQKVVEKVMHASHICMHHAMRWVCTKKIKCQKET